MRGMSRPEASVLPEVALIPGGRLVAPAPNQFTHAVRSAVPYYFSEPDDGSAAAGVLQPGTPVVLMRYDGGRFCWVVDGRGLYVAVEHSALGPR